MNMERSMKCLSRVIIVGLAIVALAGTTAAQVEPDNKELAKVQAELATTQKMLEDLKLALKKSENAEAAAQAKLAETLKSEAALRKDLEAEKAAHKKAVAKVAAAIKAEEDLRKKLESENAQLKSTVADLQLAAKEAAKAKADLLAAQTQLTKSQTDVTKYQADLAAATKAQDALSKQLAAEKAKLKSTTVDLQQAEQDAEQAKAELLATQKSLTAANLARAQLEQASQKALAEANKIADGLRKGLAAEKLQNKSTASKLEAISREAARAKADLAAVQSVLAKQPPQSITVVVTLPPDAQLAFDGHVTSSLGSQRRFISPPVSIGPIFGYELKAEVRRDGKVITLVKNIEVRAGDVVEVNLTLPTDVK